MTPAGHRDDPDAVPSASPAVAAYVARTGALGDAGPLPDAQLPYGDDRGQRLDVYAPSRARGLPVLLFFHGGAWISGHRGWLRFMAAPVLAHDIILVAATYRLAPRCRWPAQYDDALAALAFVRRHAEEWGGDPARIVVGGHSAGGQLAAFAALDGEAAACFAVSAPFDLRHGDVATESDAGRVYRFLLPERRDDSAASPLLRGADARVPFDLVWGEHDLPHVRASGAAMAAALPVVQHRVMSGASHFDTHLALADPDDDWYARLSAAVRIPELAGG